MTGSSTAEDVCDRRDGRWSGEDELQHPSLQASSGLPQTAPEDWYGQRGGTGAQEMSQVS